MAPIATPRPSASRTPSRRVLQQLATHPGKIAFMLTGFWERREDTRRCYAIIDQRKKLLLFERGPGGACQAEFWETWTAMRREFLALRIAWLARHDPVHPEYAVCVWEAQDEEARGIRREADEDE